MFGNESFAQQGWQCPICKRVYSPTTSMCFYCGNVETTTSTNLTIDLNPQDLVSTHTAGKGMCYKCPQQTDTCQEGLHCPRDAEDKEQ